MQAFELMGTIDENGQLIIQPSTPAKMFDYP